MSQLGPDSQNSLFQTNMEKVPQKLRSAKSRLEFPPSYVVVGVYRLFTDKMLYAPAWDKCKHATRRGAIVGTVWTVLTFAIQKKFVQVFLSNSPRVTGLSNETMFGYKPPFSLTTYATVLLVSSQVTYILRFFLARNIRIARDRVWAQTVTSRGKGPDFWRPYVEESENPPTAYIKEKKGWLETLTSSWYGIFILKRVLLLPFNFYPFVGILLSAWFKAIGTARNLHRAYFESKKMNKYQVAVFMEERKWDYRAFGFAAALLEGLPIIGLVFTISNRVGAAMWAHDLEKQQHFVAEQKSQQYAK